MNSQVPENIKAYYLTAEGKQKMDNWISALDESSMLTILFT